MLEIEQKYRLANADALESLLLRAGFVLADDQSQVDTYLRHPCRDFSVSGEALRLRQVNDETVVTYKGKRHDAVVKIRPEIELPVGGRCEDWLRMWQQLGFEVAEVVRKRRRVYYSGDLPELNVAVDRVEGLGDFAELEILLSEHVSSGEAIRTITALADRLALREVEPRSYLRQILEKQAAARDTHSRESDRVQPRR